MGWLYTTSTLGQRQLDLARVLTLLLAATLTLFAIIGRFPSLVPLAKGFAQPGLPLDVIDLDFANYWVAGQLAHHGDPLVLFHQDLYLPQARAMLGADFPLHNWSYPPHFLLLLWPLGFMAYKPALLVFLVVTFALFALALTAFIRRFQAKPDPVVLTAALAGFCIINIDPGQNGFLTAAALVAGLAWRGERPIMAGLAFAVLTIKPQLGLLIPVLLFIERDWKTMGWAAGFTAALVALSAALFGLESWRAYLTDTLAYQSTVTTSWSGYFLRMMPTAFGVARRLGAPADIAGLVQIPFTLLAAAVALIALRKEQDALARGFIVVVATFLVTPYALDYDMGALTVIAALMAARARGMASRLTYAAVAGLAGVDTPVAPLVLSIGLGLAAAPHLLGAWPRLRSRQALT